MYQIIPKEPGTGNTLHHKIWLIMRLTTVLILASLLQVSAATFGQKITLNQQNTALKSIFKEIRKQSGYDFIYEGSMVTNDLKASLNVNSASIEEAMNKLFQNLPLSYKITDKLVIIKKKESPSIIDNLIARFQEITVRGKVVDETGRGLPGVTIRVKDGKGSTISGANGDFEIKNVDENSTIIFSYIGYDAKEIKATSDLGSIKLNPATSKLDEVVVQAYGKTSQRLSTGNISSITSKEIENQPVTNPLLTLQGRVPGVTIEQQSGVANGGIRIRIQGQNSLASGNDPLYIVDGAPYIPSMLPGTLNTSGGSSGDAMDQASGGTVGNPLNFINPSDIESISILKDADATSIYGSRAANGAVVITTKKGGTNGTRFNLNLQNGWSRIGRSVEMMDTEQYLEMRREAIANDGRSIGPRDYDLNGIWDQNRNTNWQKELLGGTAKYHNYQASLSGGNSSTQFLLSGTYHKETTIIPIADPNLNNQKGNVHFSISHKGFKDKLNVQLSGSYMTDVNRLPDPNLFSNAVIYAPNAPSMFNEDGSLNWVLSNTGAVTFNNPAAYLKIQSRMRTDNLVSNFLTNYQILKGLKIQTGFNFTNLTEDEFYGTPTTSFDPVLKSLGIKPLAKFRTGFTRSWSFDPQLNYITSVGKHQIEALAGSTFQRLIREQTGALGYDYSTDLQLENLQAAGGVLIQNIFYRMYNYNAVFGRLSYNFDSKYLLNFNIRRDGSSRFGKENLFNNFWSLSAGWIFSEEKFVREKLGFLSFGKLTASYGTTGSDQIEDYRFMNNYTFKSFPLPYQGITGIGTDGLPNPYLQWEETRKLNVGLNLGFLKNKILLTANYYRNRSSNQLLSYKLSQVTGVGSILQNFPATLQNSGLEFDLTTINIETQNFKYTTALNLTIPRNKLIDFPNLESSTYSTRYIVGEPVNITKIFRYNRVNPQTGLYEFEDKDGIPTSTPVYYTEPGGARFDLINTNPKVFGGLTNTLSYKGFQLDFTVQYTKQLAFLAFPYDAGRFLSGRGNVSTSLLDRWRKAGDSGNFQKVSSTYPYNPSNPIGQARDAANESSFAYVDGGYLRLKNASLAWSLPASALSKLHLNSCRLYAQGQNLLTISSYRGFDPETQNTAALPPLRTYTLGLQIGL